jgi:O-acetyl-ADP-ribose deacetylase (regulator of RNase III)
VLTSGGRLPAKYIIHTVSPCYQNGDDGEAELLASCYRESIRIAEENSIKSIAFPSISTGAHLYPIGEAARVAVEAVAEALGGASHVDHVRFILFDNITLTHYLSAAEEFETKIALAG